jgi:hypothetical protein
MDQQNMNLNIDLKNTQVIEPKNGKVWSQGFILRKVSKFVTGTSEDAIIPIPVFYDPNTGEICQETLPKELRDEADQDNLRVVK